jgi:hypothetical protein
MKRNYLALLICLASVPATAEDLFPAGPESKSMGLASSLQSEGPPAVLYNPANLFVVGEKNYAEPYAELGMISVAYSYEHPDFDPVSINVVSPVATVGYTNRLNERLTFSAVIFPKESGETQIPALPRKVGSSVTPLAISNKSEVIDAGVGVGLKVIDGISVGLSGTRTFESHQTRANLIGNDNNLIEMDYHNSFNRATYGTRFYLGDLIVATVSLRPELIKNYRGSQADVSGESSDPKVVNYEPETTSIGIGGRIDQFLYGAELSKERWGKGRGVLKDGIAADEPDADLDDTTNMAITGGFVLNKDGPQINASYASIPSPWGDGFDDGELANHIYGVDFGQLDGLDRRVLSVGGKLTFRELDLSAGFSQSQGTRLVEGQGDNVGYYKLNVFTASGAIRATF